MLKDDMFNENVIIPLTCSIHIERDSSYLQHFNIERFPEIFFFILILSYLLPVTINILFDWYFHAFQSPLSLTGWPEMSSLRELYITQESSAESASCALGAPLSKVTNKTLTHFEAPKMF